MTLDPLTSLLADKLPSNYRTQCLIWNAHYYFALQIPMPPAWSNMATTRYVNHKVSSMDLVIQSWEEFCEKRR